jgi:hypothetical protein
MYRIGTISQRAAVHLWLAMNAQQQQQQQQCPKVTFYCIFNPSNAELSPICHLLALLGAHLILHSSGIRVKTVVSDWYDTLYLLY